MEENPWYRSRVAREPGEAAKYTPFGPVHLGAPPQLQLGVTGRTKGSFCHCRAPTRTSRQEQEPEPRDEAPADLPPLAAYSLSLTSSSSQLTLQALQD